MPGRGVALGQNAIIRHAPSRRCRTPGATCWRRCATTWHPRPSQLAILFDRSRLKDPAASVRCAAGLPGLAEALDALRPIAALRSLGIGTGRRRAALRGRHGMAVLARNRTRHRAEISEQSAQTTTGIGTPGASAAPAPSPLRPRVISFQRLGRREDGPYPRSTLEAIQARSVQVTGAAVRWMRSSERHRRAVGAASRWMVPMTSPQTSGGWPSAWPRTAPATASTSHWRKPPSPRHLTSPSRLRGDCPARGNNAARPRSGRAPDPVSRTRRPAGARRGGSRPRQRDGRRRSISRPVADDPDAAVRAVAMAAVAPIHPEKVTAGFRDPSPLVRRATVDALVPGGDRAVLEEGLRMFVEGGRTDSLADACRRYAEARQVLIGMLGAPELSRQTILTILEPLACAAAPD